VSTKLARSKLNKLLRQSIQKEKKNKHNTNCLRKVGSKSQTV
jgi:hypothetical protein